MTVSKYTPQTVKAAVKVAAAGGTDIEIAAAMNVRRCTYYKYTRTHPEFKEAIDAARAPKGDDESVRERQELKAGVKAWLFAYVKNQGQIDEQVDGDGAGSYTKKRRGKPPDRYLIDRILDEYLPMPESKDTTEFKMEFRILGPGETE